MNIPAIVTPHHINTTYSQKIQHNKVEPPYTTLPQWSTGS